MLKLTDNEYTLGMWPHAFEATFEARRSVGPAAPHRLPAPLPSFLQQPPFPPPAEAQGTGRLTDPNAASAGIIRR